MYMYRYTIIGILSIYLYTYKEKNDNNRVLLPRYAGQVK